MGPHHDAVALARALMSVALRTGNHEVQLTAGPRRACLRVADGWLVSLDGVDGEPLGDTLLRHGVLDMGRHAEGLSLTRQNERVGDWLVRVGAAQQHAVDDALELQLHARLRNLLAWPEPGYLMRECPQSTRPPESAPRTRAVNALWHALRDLLAETPGLDGSARPTQLSPFGRRLVPELGRADHGCFSEAELEAALAGRPRAAELRRMLDVIGAADAGQPIVGDAHALLLRKQREVRRGAPPHRLLEVPANASPVDAKRAFRRLVRQLHPDRFGVDNPVITKLSTEIVRALDRAQNRLCLRPVWPRSAVR